MDDRQFFLEPESWVAHSSGLGAHALLLYAFAVAVNAKMIVEVGVGAGTSTRALLKAAEKTGGLVHSGDWNADCAKAVTDPGLLKHWKFTHCVDSTYFAAMWFKLKLPAPDLVFLDGDHSEAGCREDFCNWAELLNPGGYIILHDSELFAGVRRFLRTIPADQFELLTVPGESGLAICRKRPA